MRVWRDHMPNGYLAVITTTTVTRATAPQGKNEDMLTIKEDVGAFSFRTTEITGSGVGST